MLPARSLTAPQRTLALIASVSTGHKPARLYRASLHLRGYNAKHHERRIWTEAPHGEARVPHTTCIHGFGFAISQCGCPGRTRLIKEIKCHDEERLGIR